MMQSSERWLIGAVVVVMLALWAREVLVTGM